MAMRKIIVERGGKAYILWERVSCLVCSHLLTVDEHDLCSGCAKRYPDLRPTAIHPPDHVQI